MAAVVAPSRAAPMAASETSPGCVEAPPLSAVAAAAAEAAGREASDALARAAQAVREVLAETSEREDD